METTETKRRGEAILNMEFPFTNEEVRILKKICANPVFKESQPLPKNYNQVQILNQIQPLNFFKRLVCNFYNIKAEDLSGKRRDKHFVQARRDYCHLAFKKTKFSTKVIGDKIKRDHTSVVHHLSKQPINIDKILNE